MSLINHTACISLSVQMFGAVESSVTMKLKGTSRSRLKDSEAALLPVPEWRHLYNRVWDVADYGEEGVHIKTTLLNMPHKSS